MSSTLWDWGRACCFSYEKLIVFSCVICFGEEKTKNISQSAHGGESLVNALMNPLEQCIAASLWRLSQKQESVFHPWTFLMTLMAPWLQGGGEKAVCLSCSLGGFSSGGAQEAGRRYAIKLQMQKDCWELNVGEKTAKGAAGHNKCGTGRQRGKWGPAGGLGL